METVQDGTLVTSGGDIADDILRYLCNNPDSKDTIEGIAQWWVLEQRIASQVRKVEEGVERLLSQGYLLAAAGPSGKRVYQVNPERLKEIRERLAED